MVRRPPHAQSSFLRPSAAFYDISWLLPVRPPPGLAGRLSDLLFRASKTCHGIPRDTEKMNRRSAVKRLAIQGARISA